MPNDMNEAREVQAMSVESGTVAMISRAEMDQQIATAKRWPRSITRFLSESAEMVTLNESIAQQCIYALPRDGKTIEGASARFGEIVASAWGNCRAGARIVNEGPEFVTAQGVFHDLERNSAITYEVQRRITNNKGKRFGADMIGVTANAACSIALRNAILKGVPKAFWEPIYKKARAVVAGDLTTLANKRANAIKEFVIFGVTEAQILNKLGRAGVADITVDDLVVLFGMLTAIKDGDTTPEQAFAEEAGNVQGPQERAAGRKDEVQGPATKANPTVQSGQGAAEAGSDVRGNPPSDAGYAVAGSQAPAAGVASVGQPPAATAPLGDQGTGAAAQVPSGVSASPDVPRGPGYVTAGALNMIRTMAKRAKKTAGDVCFRFDVDNLADLTVEKGNEALAWLRGADA